MSRVWAEIDLSAVRHNVSAIREHVGPRVGIISVVKADAYGHGVASIARAAMEARSPWLGVATVAEGRELRASLPSAQIWVLSPFSEDECEDLIQSRLTCLLSNRSQARKLSAAAVRAGTTAGADLEVDTGMGRSGVLPEHAVELARAAQNLNGIRLTGLCTHFPSAEDDPEFTAHQLTRFEQARVGIAEAGISPGKLHAANSAALLRYPAAHYNLVRPGLLLYGIVPGMPDVTPGISVRPVMSLRTRIRLIRDLPAGHNISYGQTHRLSRPSRVATIPVGYGDGYPRSLSNVGSVLVGGARAPILGRVCMDVTVIDVTDVPTAEVGTEVVLIGKQGDDTIRVEEIARLASTTEHDVTTRLTSRVEKRYIG